MNNNFSGNVWVKVGVGQVGFIIEVDALPIVGILAGEQEEADVLVGTLAIHHPHTRTQPDVTIRWQLSGDDDRACRHSDDTQTPATGRNQNENWSRMEIRISVGRDTVSESVAALS